MNKNNPSDRILELDVLRGLTAVAVLLYHYTTHYAIMYPHQGDPLFYFAWIPFRTPFFAILSGFVIMMISEKTKNPVDFFVARFSRLYPCYFVAVIFTSILIMTFPVLGKGVFVTWPVVLSNMTMLQPWLGYANIDPVYWYLAPELTFYFIILMAFTFKKTKYIESIGVWGLLLVVLNARLGHFGPFEVPAAIVVSKILNFWQFFFAGILFYNLKTMGENWGRHIALALCFITQSLISDNFHNVLYLAGFFLVFYLFIYGKLSWIVNKPLLFLGTISYNLYLIHLRMGYIIIKYLYLFGANTWLRLLIPAFISILMATFMTFCIEKPAMSYIRKKYAQWKARQGIIDVPQKEENSSCPNKHKPATPSGL